MFQYLLSIPEHKQNNDQQKFLPFYFVAQSLFYLIIFRWETIGIENLRDLNLQTIVFSKLNPLAELVPAVAIKFCDVMKETEILFGHVIIEQVNNLDSPNFRRLRTVLDCAWIPAQSRKIVIYFRREKNE